MRSAADDKRRRDLMSLGTTSCRVGGRPRRQRRGARGPVTSCRVEALWIDGGLLFGGLGGLGVDDGSGGARLSPRRFADSDVERFVMRSDVGSVPKHEIGMRGALGRQIFGQGFPLAARCEHIEDRVENLAHDDPS